MLEAYLFGSVARREAQAHSDVDVAVYVEPAALARPGFGIGAELGSLLSSALGRDDVDVVVLNTAPILLYHRVLKDGVRLLSRDLRATTVREGQALSRYCDHVPQHYASALDELGRMGVLSPDLARRLRPLAGFRNALVDGYMTIDVSRLHDVLNQHLGEVREFAQSIDALLSAERPDR